MGFSDFKKNLLAHIIGLVIMLIGIGMLISLWLYELPKEMENGGTFDWIWFVPISIISFGAVVLFAVDKLVLKFLNISGKAINKFIDDKEDKE